MKMSRVALVGGLVLLAVGASAFALWRFSSQGHAGAAPATTATSLAGPQQSPDSRPVTPLGARVPLDTAPLPATGTRYDPWKPATVGQVLELPVSGLVVQVTGASVKDSDGGQKLLLVNLVIGNRGKDTFTISSLLTMHAVTGDWHWYSLSLPDLMQAAPTLNSLNVKTFDVDLAPGEACRGTAVLPIPAAAQQVALAFDPVNSLNPFATTDPTVFVSLGIGGDFAPPIIPEDAQAVTPRTVYSIGQALKSPSRHVALQVNGVRELLEAPPDVHVRPNEKLVLVDVTLRTFGDANAVDADELAVVDSEGRELLNADTFATRLARSEHTAPYSPGHRRGMLAYVAPRDAGGFKFKFRPQDPASSSRAPLFIDAETAVVDLAGPSPAKAGR